MFEKKKFAEALIIERVLERRISIRKCAKECGVHFSNISRYERQEITPNIEHFLLICEWLNKKPSEFLNEANSTT